MFFRFPDGTLINSSHVTRIEVVSYVNHVSLVFTVPSNMGFNPSQTLTVDTKANAEKLLNKIWELIGQKAPCIDLSTIMPSSVQNNVYLVEEDQKRGI